MMAAGFLCDGEPILAIAGISWLGDTSLSSLPSHSHGISPVRVSKYFLFIKMSDCLESHPDDLILTNRVHISPISK